MNGPDFQNQFKLAPDNYLARNYIMEYLNDSVQQLLDIRNSNPKIEVLEFFTEYFKSVKQGTHILFRDYSFISATPHNRACFIEKILETYTSMLEKEEALKTCDFHALILLLCPDFPLEIVEKSLKMISKDENLSAYFKDFIYAFQFQFYYKEFARQSRLIFENGLAKVDDPTSSILNAAKPLTNNLTKKKFLDNLESLSHQVNYSFPSKSILKEAMRSKDSEINYEEFTLELARNEKLTLEIGKLPTRSQLAEYRSKRLAELKIEQIPEEAKLEAKCISAKEKIKRITPPPNAKYPSDDSVNSSSDSTSDSDV